MDITQLRYFLKTAETLNYSRAAESLFIARQSLRQAIAAMEGELGASLFHNERNHLSLTECGAYLALRGTEVVEGFDRVWGEARRLAVGENRLRVAFSESLFPFLLPEMEGIFDRFRSRFPHIALETGQRSVDEIIRSVEAGELDCGCVLQMPCERPGWGKWVLERFPAVLDFGEGFPLFDRAEERLELKIEELEGLTCIGMGSFREWMRPLWEDCRTRGIQVDYRVVPNTIDAFYQIQNGLAAGFDILDEGELGSRPIRSALLPGYEWELALLYREKGESRGAAEVFCAFLGEELGAYFKERE